MGKRYFIRALKYFLFLVVFFVVIFGGMLLLKQSSLDTLLTIWGTKQARGLIIAFIAIPLIYPFIGYVRRDVRGSFTEKRAIIDRVLAMSGYTVTEDTPEKIVAYTKGIKKVSLLFEDRVEITPAGSQFVTISGPRKEVSKMEFRMRTYMNL